MGEHEEHQEEEQLDSLFLRADYLPQVRNSRGPLAKADANWQDLDASRFYDDAMDSLALTMYTHKFDEGRVVRYVIRQDVVYHSDPDRMFFARREPIKRGQLDDPAGQVIDLSVRQVWALAISMLWQLGRNRPYFLKKEEE